MTEEETTKKNEEIIDKKNNEEKNENTETIKSEKVKSEELKERKKLIAIFFLSGLIVVSIIIFIIVFDFFPDLSKGQFECTYYCTGEEIQILNKDYKTDNLKIIINDKEYENTNPKYNQKGEFNVTIKVLSDELDMKNMFAFTNVKTVKMSSKDKMMITNMESSFENCNYLEKFEIQDFNTSNVTTMSKFFYKDTNLKEVDIQNMDTTNLTDVSYMFAYTNVPIINMSNFDIEVLLRSIDVFKDCTSKIIIKIDDKTNNETINNLSLKYPTITIEEK